MPITFLIPGPLRPFSGGKSRVVIESSPTTLAEALEALWNRCPGMRGRVATEQAQIRQHINVFVGKEDIRYTGGLQTPVPEGAEIAIIPAVSGGSREDPWAYGYGLIEGREKSL
jgi:molybdopterin synthase sulfur carrier subunit